MKPVRMEKYPACPGLVWFGLVWSARLERSKKSQPASQRGRGDDRQQPVDRTEGGKKSWNSDRKKQESK